MGEPSQHKQVVWEINGETGIWLTQLSVWPGEPLWKFPRTTRQQGFGNTTWQRAYCAARLVAHYRHCRPVASGLGGLCVAIGLLPRL